MKLQKKAQHLGSIACIHASLYTVYLRFLILQRRIASEHICVLNSLLHVGMTGTMVQHQASDQPITAQKKLLHLGKDAQSVL